MIQGDFSLWQTPGGNYSIYECHTDNTAGAKGTETPHETGIRDLGDALSAWQSHTGKPIPEKYANVQLTEPAARDIRLPSQIASDFKGAAPTGVTSLSKRALKPKELRKMGDVYSSNQWKVTGVTDDYVVWESPTGMSYNIKYQPTIVDELSKESWAQRIPGTDIKGQEELLKEMEYIAERDKTAYEKAKRDVANEELEEESRKIRSESKFGFAEIGGEKISRPKPKGKTWYEASEGLVSGPELTEEQALDIAMMEAREKGRDIGKGIKKPKPITFQPKLPGFTDINLERLGPSDQPTLIQGVRSTPETRIKDWNVSDEAFMKKNAPMLRKLEDSGYITHSGDASRYIE